MAVTIEYGLNLSDDWDTLFTSFVDRSEECYLRWINDDELSDAEIRLAVAHQEAVEAEDSVGDMIEVEIPPEHDLSPEEFDAFIRIAKKMHKQGLGSLIELLAGVTVDTLETSKLSCNMGSTNGLEIAIDSNETLIN